MGVSLKLFFCSVLPLFFRTDGVTSEKIIDLTWKFDNETIFWSGVMPFRYTKKVASTDRGYWYASNEFEASEHGGTHFDAPYHFVENGWKVDDIPPERLFVHAVLLDFTNEVESVGTDYVVDLEVLKQKLDKIEPIANNSVLLFKFGWSKYWQNKQKYLGSDDHEILHFPGLNNASSTMIANCRKFVGVGVDTASVDVGNSQTFDAHRILLGKNIYILENMKIVEHLPEKDFRLIVAPMKLGSGTGAPSRLLAILND